jgi:hypothetical protein
MPLVLEVSFVRRLGLPDGFWGLVEQGVEVGLVHNQATLIRDGTPLVEQAGTDLTGLLEAETAVATLGRAEGEPEPRPGVELPAGATPETVATIHRRLRALAERWRGLDDGAAIALTFSRRTA